MFEALAPRMRQSSLLAPCAFLAGNIIKRECKTIYLQPKTYNCGINCAGEKWLLFFYSQKAKYEEMLKDAKQKCDEETKTVSILL